MMLTVPEDSTSDAVQLGRFLRRSTGAEFLVESGVMHRRSLVPDAETVRVVARSVSLIALAGGPLVAAIKMLPDYVRARRTSIKVVVWDGNGDQKVEVELSSVNAEDAMRVIERALSSEQGSVTAASPDGDREDSSGREPGVRRRGPAQSDPSSIDAD